MREGAQSSIVTRLAQRGMLHVELATENAVLSQSESLTSVGTRHRKVPFNSSTPLWEQRLPLWRCGMRSPNRAGGVAEEMLQREALRRVNYANPNQGHPLSRLQTPTLPSLADAYAESSRRRRPFAGQNAAPSSLARALSSPDLRARELMRSFSQRPSAGKIPPNPATQPPLDSNWPATFPGVEAD